MMYPIPMTSTKRSVEEERNLYLDRPMKGKSQEQLRRHAVEQSIDKKPIERSLYILTMGEDTQKMSVVHSLPHLLTLDSSAVHNRIIPKIKQDLPSSSCEFQLATSATYMVLLQRCPNVAILEAVVLGVAAKDPNVAFAWAQTLFGCLAFLPESMVQEHVLPLAKQKFQPNATVASKVFCGRLMGEICANVKFRLINVRREILPIVIGLCQDGNADVRSQMCAYLPKVAMVLGNEWEKTNLLSCVVELARDENLNVRATSIVAISSMMQILSQETSRNILLPLVKGLCEKASEESLVSALILSGELGTLLNEMTDVQVEDIVFFLRIYKKLSQKGKESTAVKANASIEVTIRQRCATNFYVIIKLAKKLVPAQVHELYATFREHTVDPCYLVRKAAAAVLADVAELLDNDNKMMKNEIVRILRDDTVEVLEAIVPTLSSLFTSLVNSGLLSPNEASQNTVELCKALIKCHNELRKRYNWRLTIDFLKQFEVLPMCVPANYIHTNFTPILFDKLLNGKAKPVKNQAARTLVVIMRFNFTPNQNKWIRDSLIRQTALSTICYNRLLYFYVCEAVLDVYSEKYFKQWFLSSCLSLASDKVENVRWKFMHFSTRLKSMVSLARDVTAKQLILDTISKLETSEKTKSVLDIIRIKKREPLPKYLPEMLRQEDARVREEQTTNIKRIDGAPTKPTKTVSPEPKQVSISSDMRFLEHHFYIDAGIKLETVLGLDSVSKHDSEALDTADFIAIESCNITDDAKVNLRKIQSKLTPVIHNTSDISAGGDATRNKRYSSIISANCFEISKSNDKMTQKRRSLNLQYCDSKIPIAHRTKNKTSAINVLITKQENTKNNGCTNSSLYNSTCIQHSALVSGVYGKPRGSTPSNKPAGPGSRPSVRPSVVTASRPAGQPTASGPKPVGSILRPTVSSPKLAASRPASGVPPRRK